MKYTGKTAIITGGTTGIGFATARLFTQEGGKVLVTGRTPSTVESAQKELGANAKVLVSDTARLSDLDALKSEASSFLGHVDFLFVNAGIAKFAPLEQVTEAFFDEIVNVNTKGALFAVQKLTPLFKRGSGVVLNTSVADELGMASSSVYAASKAALRSLGRTLATELLPHGVRVNAVMPGPITTPIYGKLGFPKEALAGMQDQMREQNPMKRFGDADEVAKAALFLAFDATYTTGAELPVDGGLTQL
jgi:NAD(P)-dependent dehydrogenase (short-subunit alcohol dehydrogenase family)